MRSLNSIKNFSKWMVSSSSLKRKDLWKLPKKLLNEKPVHAVCARSSKTLCSMSCLSSLHGTTLKSASYRKRPLFRKMEVLNSSLEMAPSSKAMKRFPKKVLNSHAFQITRLACLDISALAGVITWFKPVFLHNHSSVRSWICLVRHGGGYTKYNHHRFTNLKVL